MLRRSFLLSLLATPVAASEFPGFVDDVELFSFAVKKPEPKLKRYYNEFRTGPNWTYSGVQSKAALIRHLMQGPHRGKFDRKVLERISYDRLLKLHSNDHEGKPFFYSYDGFPMKTKKATPVKSTSPDCPT